MGHASPKCTAEFEQGAVQLCRERGGTYAEIGGELGADPGGVPDRVKRADAAGSDPSANPFQVAGENRRPKRGNERLGRESEMLLEASAFFAGGQLQAPGRRGLSSRSCCSARACGRSRRCAPPSGPRGGATAPDLVRRDFAAGGPDRLRFADTTCVGTRRGWPCLAVVMDVRSGTVVGWSMSASMAAELADDAPEMAIARRRPGKGCVHRSDHGSQYAPPLLGKTMREAGIVPSVGSISSPWDNAAMESLMGIIKCECVHARTFGGREQAALEIFDYIESFYNRARTHSALGYLSPEELERANRPEDDRRLKAA